MDGIILAFAIMGAVGGTQMKFAGRRYTETRRMKSAGMCGYANGAPMRLLKCGKNEKRR